MIFSFEPGLRSLVGSTRARQQRELASEVHVQVLADIGWRRVQHEFLQPLRFRVRVVPFPRLVPVTRKQ
ncbi:MAG: hypothetical protein WDO74_15755 [Pseudomonadota bacterium]